MPVSSAFSAWREAEHAALDAQTAIHRAHIDHWIGPAPAPDPQAIAEAVMLQMRAHQLLLELLTDMRVTARALRETAAERGRRTAACGEDSEPTEVPAALSWREWISSPARALPAMTPTMEAPWRRSGLPGNQANASEREPQPVESPPRT